MEELSQLIDETGMSVSDFAYAVGTSKSRIERMLNGVYSVPQGLIGDAIQLLEDIDYVKAHFELHPEFKNMSYKVFKTVLDTKESH